MSKVKRKRLKIEIKKRRQEVRDRKDLKKKFINLITKKIKLKLD
jgi:hypothetical protein